MARLLVLMGSGETTPTMVETHKRILSQVGDDHVMVDTPYGFQENADELTARTRGYFAKNVEADVEPVSLRNVEVAGPAATEAAVARIERADWMFCGPGSPSYLLRQWRATRLPAVLRDRLGRAGATVVASAAACTLGRFAVPVYEIYKVGEPPRWIEGLDVLSAIDLPAVVVPHWDNAEGGTHDTRFCYLGERRLLLMEGELPDDVGVLGVDEHTAAIIDLEAGTLSVEGRGGVVARYRGSERRWETGQTASLDDVRPALLGRGGDGTSTTSTATVDDGSSDQAAPATPFEAEVTEFEASFTSRVERGELVAAADAVIRLADLIADWAADPDENDHAEHARSLLRRMVVRLASTAEAGLHDHRDLVAPHVETLLDLRERAREGRDFATADRIRDDLAKGGVEVRDTADGTAWEFDDPLDDA